MKKYFIALLVFMLIAQYSCITDKDKYKETDLFEEYETEEGFAILHIPSIIFKMALSVSDEENNINTEQLLDKVELIKVMFFEPHGKTMKKDDLKNSLNQKVTDFNYNLLTRIAEENNDIAIYVKEKDEKVREVLILIDSGGEYIGLNLIGNLSKDEILKVYQAINMQKIKGMNN